MAEETNGHATLVAAWFERVCAGHPPASQLELLERAFEALWARVRPTLGEVTLAAIAERVFYDAGERFPLFESVEVGLTGVRFEGARGRAGEARADELGAAVRFVLTTFLTVLGHLTAEVLTPGLHATLAAAAPGPPAGARGGGRGPERRRGKKHGKP
jgi:hypothetical protein